MAKLTRRPGAAHRQELESGACGAMYSIDEALDRCGIGGRFHWCMLVYCGLSWAVDAMEVMILTYLNQAAKCEWNLSAWEEGLLTSMVFMGMTLGAPVWGAVSDAFGRKKSFAAATICTTVFGFATAAAPNYAALMAFRTLVGFGIPAATVAFNLMLEFTPTRLRGTFAVGIEGFWTIGTIVQAGLAYGLLNKYGWRILVLASTAPYVVLLVLLPFLPESPRFLLVKGRTDQAEQVLGKVMRNCKKELPEGRLQPLLAEDPAVVDPAEPQAKGMSRVTGKLGRGAVELWQAVKALFSQKLWAITLILMFTWTVSAFVYYGLVQLVAKVDFVKGGEKGCRGNKLYIPTEDLTAILITSSAEVPGLIFSLLMVSFLGRKIAFAIPLMLIAVVLIPMMTGVEGAGAIACMYLARFFIYSSFNILWAMTPEYYPTAVRNFGLGVNNAFSRIGGLLSPFAINAAVTSWAKAPEAIFAALSLVAGAAVFLLPPDKKGQALEDTLDEVKGVPAIQRRLSSINSQRRSSSSIDNVDAVGAVGAAVHSKDADDAVLDGSSTSASQHQGVLGPRVNVI